MAFLSELLRQVSGANPVTRAVNNIIPQGTGHRVAQWIANTGQQHNLPEINLSEKFGNYVPMPKQAYASGNPSQGVQGVQDQQGGAGVIPGAPPDATQRTALGGGGGGAYTTNNSDANLSGMAGDARTSALNAITSRINMMRDIANRSRGEARGVRDEIVGNIGTTYGNLEKSLQDKVAATLSNLGQEDIKTQNIYGRAAGNSRRATAGALLKNRMLARAMNRLDSSFYDDRQAGTNEAGARAISDIGLEEADKRAGIATRSTETKNWGEQQAAALDAEEAQLTSQADQEYQRQISAANDMERSYGIDSVEAAEEAERTYQSRLDQIRDYIQNKATRMAEYATSAEDNASEIASFEGVNPTLARILANNAAIQGSENLGDQLPTFSGMNNTGGSLLSRIMNRNLYDEEQRRLGNLLAPTA